VSKKKTNSIPNTPDAKAQLKKFFQNFMPAEQSYLTPWREAASDEIKKYTEAGMALRGARYREGLSQKALAKLCGISQDNLSRMETGKRAIGEKLAKKLGQILDVDYRLFMRKKL
jgi:ribosome-binding protein aMBF1 (putative translation factor)